MPRRWKNQSVHGWANREWQFIYNGMIRATSSRVQGQWGDRTNWSVWRREDKYEICFSDFLYRTQDQDYHSGQCPGWNFYPFWLSKQKSTLLILLKWMACQNRLCQILDQLWCSRSNLHRIFSFLQYFFSFLRFPTYDYSEIVALLLSIPQRPFSKFLPSLRHPYPSVTEFYL